MPEDEVKPSLTKDHVHYDNTNRPTKDKMKTHVTNKGKGGPVSREKARVGDTIEKLNELHSKVTDIREQLSGGDGTRGQRVSSKKQRLIQQQFHCKAFVRLIIITKKRRIQTGK